MVHITVAVIVAILAIATGIQGTVRGGILRRMGFVLLTLVVLQLLLGVGAVVGVYVPEPAVDTGAIPAWAVLLTSAHQANGALLLMAAAVMAAWAGRLALRSSAVQPDEPASASPPQA
jgi:thiazole synthase ThiGH ThiG subunit